MAKKYWRGRQPDRPPHPHGQQPTRPWITVVGIVGDQQHNGVGDVGEGEVLPAARAVLAGHAASRRADMTLVVKTPGDPLQALPVDPARGRALDPALPIAAVRPMTDVVAAPIAAPRFTGWLLGLFAALGAHAGGGRHLRRAVVPGQPAYARDRHPHGGWRAGPREVVRLVLGRGLGLALGGVAIGLVAAFAASRVMGGLLYRDAAARPGDLHQRAGGADACGDRRQPAAGAAGDAGRSDRRAADGVERSPCRLLGRRVCLALLQGFRQHPSFNVLHLDAQQPRDRRRDVEAADVADGRALLHPAARQHERREHLRIRSADSRVRVEAASAARAP